MSQLHQSGTGGMAPPPPPPSISPSPSPPPPTLSLHPSGSSSCLHSSSSSASSSVPTTPDIGDGDEAVQATNDDASICKRSAVHLGYWNDPFLQHFMKGPVVRKPPEINRGYYARTYGVFKLIIKTLGKIANTDVVSYCTSFLCSCLPGLCLCLQRRVSLASGVELVLGFACNARHGVIGVPGLCLPRASLEST